MRIAELLTLSDQEFLHEAYRLVLGREIDQEGLNGYLMKIGRGKSKESILVDLARSIEAKKRFLPPFLLNLPEEEFIDSIYIRILGRNADADGMQHYLARLRNHDDRLKILRSIGASEEARRHDPESWEFRQNLDDLIRRETSFLGWRKWMPSTRGQSPASARTIASADRDQDYQTATSATKAEFIMLTDQVMLLASAMEGMLMAQRSENARIEQLSEKITELKNRVESQEQD